MVRPELKRKGWKKTIFLASVPIVFAACLMWGPADVGNAPGWLSKAIVYGDWEPWPGENHPLAKILPDRLADKKQYDGYFRIGSYSAHEWSINFSDGSGDLFRIWLGVVQGGGSIEVPQPDPDVFEFDARMYSENGPVPHPDPDDVMPAGTGFPVTIRYERMEEADGYRCDSDEFPCYRFKIVLKDEGELFDTSMTSLHTPKDPKRPSWLPTGRYYQASKDASDPSYTVYTLGLGGDYISHIGPWGGEDPNLHYSHRQEEIDNEERRVLYSRYKAPPDIAIYYIEAHRNTRETVVFRFMDRNKNVLDEGTGWIIDSEALDTW